MTKKMHGVSDVELGPRLRGDDGGRAPLPRWLWFIVLYLLSLGTIATVVFTLRFIIRGLYAV